MISMDLIEGYFFSAPIVCALACMLMMLMDAQASKHSRQEKNLRLFLAATYLVTSMGWLGMVFYSVSPRLFAAYYTVFLLTLMFDQVMIYRFVTIITNTGERRSFNKLHLIVPLIILLLSLTSEEIKPILTTVIFIVYNTLYPLLNLRKIQRYRRFIVNYSADAYNASLGWLAFIQVFILVSVPIPLAGLLLGTSSIAFNYFAWLGALPYFINYLILCYNLLNDNYLIIQPEDMGDDNAVKTVVVARKHFERYLRDKKPYLNPNLRITEVAAGLNTNRTYISSFIKKEYGMNFCRFINRCRLQELDRLRLQHSNAKKTNIDLVLMAGFSNYRSYLRVKKEEDRMTLLKLFD